MGRSNKEARMTHSGYTIETGHGGLKRNRVTTGKKVEVGGPEEGTGMTKAKTKQGGRAAAPAPKTEESTAPSGDADSGWGQIGEAGASMVKTYQRNKAAKA